MILKILAAGAVAGVAANVTGFVITAKLFHRYQAGTPNTWREAESRGHYLASSAIRVFACIAIGFLYGLTAAGVPGASFGLCLWAAVAAPIILELAIFVKWHRGFVVGLLLDWLVLCLLASVASSLAQRL
jgi:hypothetical protein